VIVKGNRSRDFDGITRYDFFECERAVSDMCVCVDGRAPC
jgi:hypothetical protein